MWSFYYHFKYKKVITYFLLFSIHSNCCTNLFTELAEVSQLSSQGTIIPTVSITKQKDSYLLRRTGSNWFSNFMDINRIDAPQGNPLWALFIPGKNVSEFVGFKIIKEDRELEVPTPEMLNKKLQKINTKLPEGEKCLVSFYHPKGELSSYDYLKNFAERLQLPIESEGITLVHDISYHVWSSNMYPNAATKLAALQTKEMLKLIDFVNIKIKETPPQEASNIIFLEAVRNRLIAKQVNAIDLGTGVLTNYFARPHKDHTAKEAYKQYTNSGENPRSYFIKTTTDLRQKILDKAVEHKASENAKLKSMSIYNNLILDYYKHIGGIEKIPDTPNVTYTESELCDKIVKKRALLQSAVQGL